MFGFYLYNIDKNGLIGVEKMIDDNKFHEIINNLEKSTLKVESLLISQYDKNYYHLFGSEKLKDIRSISKMVTGLVLGVAIAKGYFKNGIDTYVLPYFKEVAITNRENLKYLEKLQIKHLISYTAGYDKQLLNKAHLSTIQKVTNYTSYVLNYPLKYAIGEKFVFCNAPIYLLSIMIEKETGFKLKDFAKKEIFSKMDITHFEWEESLEKHTWGATGLKLLPTDLHKIGKLLLNNGKYNDKQIIPSNWIKEMKTLRNLSPNEYVKGRVIPKYGHGYTLWLCENDIYFHDAKGGQYVICVPQKNMIITITANDEEHRHDILENLRQIIAS